jgi:anti-sigma factor RsiW
MRLFQPGAIACQELVELVTDYFEGALSRRDRRRFEHHIAGCDGCTAYLEQMRATLRAVGSLSGESIAPEARDALLHAFRDWEPDRPPTAG